MPGCRTPSALDLLRRNPRLAQLAAFPFDFDLERAEHGEEVALASGAPLTGIAGDDTGGTYFLCADGAVLYADSDGRAALIGRSVADVLELVTGLPGWRDHLELPPGTGDDEVTAAARAHEADLRASYAPDLDARRTELLTGLGLTRRPPTELFARMRQALRDTEPEHVLLLTEEGTAYELLGGHPGPPLAEAVLTACRLDLERLRADPAAWQEAAFCPVPGGEDPEHDAHAALRAAVLHAARYDRRPADLPLLRHLLEQETRCRREAPFGGMGEELHLAVFLVARLLREEDLPLLYAARAANFDTWCALSDLPLGLPGKGAEEKPSWEPEALRRWVEALDTPEWFGDDPGREPDETWVTLARRRGRTELARVALIRALDDIGPADTAELLWISAEFEALGDLRQAARAQRLHTRLQGTAEGRAAGYTRLASLERRYGDLDGASASLRAALEALEALGVATAPAEAVGQPALFEVEPARAQTRPHRPDRGNVLDLTLEHFQLARTAAETGHGALGRQSLATASALLAALARPLPPALLRAAHSAALACADTEPADRCAALVADEERRAAGRPRDGDDAG
ncbi:hypothetical protein ACIRU5_18390 [Streptomyces misionensis]|uniref:hypothetical protein n=1 Tax=Streptomyces misionensis TaxID=67331 RepID=UPI00380FAD85